MSAKNTRIGSGFITKGGIYAAGTTQYKAIPGSAATNLNRGEIKAAGTVRAGTKVIAGTAVEVGTTLTVGSGYSFAAGDFKLLACGTYIGSGAATAALVDTGLTTVHKVLMNLQGYGYSGATHNSAGFPQPDTAAGTPGSFYPLVGYIAPGAAVNYTMGVGAAASFAWLALGV